MSTQTSSNWQGAAPFDARAHALERMSWQRRYLPNAQLVTHDERKVSFYDDLVRGQRVVIGVTYASCQNRCLPVARNLLDARERLGPLGRSMRFMLLTLTPLDDRPADLRAAMARNGLGDDWTLLTGRPSEVERVTQALGLLPRNAADRDVTSHSTLVRVGDEPAVRWGHAAALNPPESIARMIRFALV